MKEYRFKINGKDYNVAVNGIQANVADVTVNGVQYNVELEDGDSSVNAAGSTGLPYGNASAALQPHHSASLRNTPSYDAEGGTVSGGKPVAATNAAQTVKSPLPGVIIEISVKEGQAVKAGQKVAVLEAMKMENEIQACADGTVTEIHVQRGNSVLEGAEIVTIA